MKHILGSLASGQSSPLPLLSDPTIPPVWFPPPLHFTTFCAGYAAAIHPCHCCVMRWLQRRYNTFTLDDAEKQMNNPRLAFSANLNRLKKYADQGELSL